ncbi:hypothetical protein AACH06_18595 [Ideonella sp. DXS29W]|uniref:Uncharacterized protein n=1 Tax=Ideonella lacteola TaxID=2984193 RepID=A0ABU9BVB4_9BURK
MATLPVPQEVTAHAAPTGPARWICIFWPAFVMAGVLEALVFTLVDPGELHWFGSTPVTWEPTTLYSVAFLVFWMVISMASALTQFLVHPETQ